MLQVSVYRYNPETDREPYMQDLRVDVGGKDLMVLDVLELLKAQDPSLTYRRSCREGVCGSDGMNMNGKNGLACITPLSETVRSDRLVVRPVSYTHLRAHETVLDILCRLLLEKKKNSNRESLSHTLL